MSDQLEEQWRVLGKAVGPWQVEGSGWGVGSGRRRGGLGRHLNFGDQDWERGQETLGISWGGMAVTRGHPQRPWLALAGWRVSERETRGSPVSQLSLFPPSSASGKGSEPSTYPDSEG